MLTQLINRQRGWQGGDQHMIMSPSGATEGKAQAEPETQGHVHCGSGFWFSVFRDQFQQDVWFESSLSS